MFNAYVVQRRVKKKYSQITHAIYTIDSQFKYMECSP